MSSTLHVRQFGPDDGMPLLMLHGVTGHGGHFRRFADYFIDGHRVLAPDLRGHGNSTHLPPWTLEQHAADLLSVLDSLEVTGLPVVGHSFGAAAAIHLARLAPQRITKLVLLDPAIGLDPQFALDTMPPWPHVSHSAAQAADWLREKWAGTGMFDVDEELRENFVRMGDSWLPRYSYPATTTAWSEMSRAAQLPPPDTRTLLVSALRSPFVRPAFVRACRITLGDNLTTAELDCGHMLYVERPVDTAELVMDFLGRRPGGPR